MRFDYLVIGAILIGVGMFIVMIPNQRALAKRGIQNSLSFTHKIANEMNEKSMAKIQDKKIRMCVKCGRNIPFDANLCPYCGHDYRD